MPDYTYQDKIETVIRIHMKSPHTRWDGFPRATREVHYCMEDQQEWPCRTVQAIEEQN